MQSKNSSKNKKKIVITGAAGFVGRNVVQKLLRENYFVISVDMKDPKIKSKYHKFYKSTVKNFFLEKKIKNLHAIIHLASDPRNNYYYIKPDLALENISNTFLVLNYIKNLKIKPMLIFSSTKQIELDIKEKNMGPYSISKKFSEEIINFYTKNYGIKSFIIRFTEVFSMNDNPKNKALKKLIDRCSKNKEIVVDDKNHNFEFISIDVICKGIVKILKNRIKSRFINFYGNKLNIMDLLKKIKRNLKSKSKIKVIKRSKKKFSTKIYKEVNFKLIKTELFTSKLNKLIKNELG